MKRPQEFRIDETMDLLSQVRGHGLKVPGHVKHLGGDRGKVDPATLHVENTNTAVEKITGGALRNLTESGPKSAGFVPVMGSLTEDEFSHQWETIIHAFDSLRKSAAGDSDGKLFMYMREACMALRDGQTNGVLQASRYLKGAADVAAKLAKEMG